MDESNGVCRAWVSTEPWHRVLDLEVTMLRLLACLAWLGCAAAAYSKVFQHPSVSQFHHGAFHDLSGSVRAQVHRFLHSRAELPFQVPLEVNVVLVGFNADGGYRYSLDADKLKEVLNKTMPSHRPSCLETAKHLDIEHSIYYNVIPVGQIELLTLESVIKENMVAAGNARESEFGNEIPLYEVEATKVEPVFDQLYKYLFGEVKSDSQMNEPVPNAIFVLNFDKVRMDPRVATPERQELSKIEDLTNEQLQEQEAGYVYRYRYNNGASTQVWLSSGRYAVIDISAGPCTYGKVDSEEGSVGYRSIPRLHGFFFARRKVPLKERRSAEIFCGQIAALVASAIEHVISPDIRYETVDVAQRLLVSVIVLRNHHQHSLIHSKGNDSIDMQEIEKQVKRIVQPGQEVVVVGGTHNLHDHEKLAIAVRKALRSFSTHETSKDGRYQARVKTYLDGSILREEFRQSAEVLASGLLELADSSRSNEYFIYKDWEEETFASKHSVIKFATPGAFGIEEDKIKKRMESRLQRAPTVTKAHGTRVVPVFVLSLAGMDKELLMEGESAVWTSNDAVFVVQHANEPFPLSFVSETKRREAVPASPQRHIIAGLAAVVGGLASPYEKASTVHGRPSIDWLWACGHHPFGPFSETQGISQLLIDTSLRNSIYARVDKSLQMIRASTERIESFAQDFLRSALGEPVKLQKKSATAEAWLEKFFKKTDNLPRPIPDDMVEQLKNYLDELERQLVDLSSLLYDHRFTDALHNATDLLRHTHFAKQYVDYVLESEEERLTCCRLEYRAPVNSRQAFIYGGILLAGCIVYFGIILLSSPDHHRN